MGTLLLKVVRIIISRTWSQTAGRLSLRGRIAVALGAIAVLAVSLVVVFNRYVKSAQTSEATAVIGSIRAAEENYRAETLTYLGCSSSLADVYPQTHAPDRGKWSWINPKHPDYPCWRMLNASTDGPVQYGYAVVAGPPGPVDVPGLDADIAAMLPNPSPEPWFVVAAVGGGELFVSTSWTDVVLVRDR